MVSAGIDPRTNSLQMFINDLEDGVQSTVLKFADDTKLYTELTNEEGGEQLQEDLDKCTEWAKQWMMEFNVAKCKVLHAGRTNRMKEYTMEGKILEKVQEEKDLGVMVHNAMNGSRQVTEAVKKANRALAQLRRRAGINDRLSWIRWTFSNSMDFTVCVNRV